MPKIKLPDGSVKEFDKPINFDELASSIGSGLAKATVAGMLNGKLVDASELIESDSDAISHQMAFVACSMVMFLWALDKAIANTCLRRSAKDATPIPEPEVNITALSNFPR